MARIHINDTQAGVTRLPPCLFCLEDGVRQKAQYDFMDKKHRWTFGCRPHWAQYRHKKALGTGFAIQLVLVEK